MNLKTLIFIPFMAACLLSIPYAISQAHQDSLAWSKDCLKVFTKEQCIVIAGINQ